MTANATDCRLVKAQGIGYIRDFAFFTKDLRPTSYRKSPARIAKDACIAHFQSLGANNSVSDAPGATLTWEMVAALECRLVGRVVLPSSPDYDKARQESNPAFQAYPAIIVYCACENDVLECLAIARNNRLWVAVRSGGHRTAGYSVNSGMVVDLSEIQGVVFDPPHQRVHVRPGTDFDHFIGAMNHTGWHVPTGACGNVHVGGFVQGGGYGYTSRQFGIQSDLVESFRVALADGTIVSASADEHPDLYWAMRGGTGGNFGVLLQVTYRMFSLDQVWAWSISWDEADAAQVLTLMQEGFMKAGAPDALGHMMNVGFHNGVPVYMVQGMYCGTREEGLAAIAPLLAISSAQLLVDKSGTYPENEHMAGRQPLHAARQSARRCSRKLSQWLYQRVTDSSRLAKHHQLLQYLPQHLFTGVPGALWWRHQSLSDG
jgi:hypothetical protein